MAPLGVFARGAGVNDMINKSGRQRMLSQRMAKAYLQLGQAIEEKHSRKILDASVSQFDLQLTELLAFAPTADNKATLADMDKTWQGFKQRLTGRAPNQEDARSIMSLSEDILALAQAATDQLEKNSGSAGGKLVNLSGRQRMLSQRMAKFYQAIRWGVAPADAAGKLDRARSDFVAAMKILDDAPGNTQAIRDGLSLAAQQWAFFDAALRQGIGPNGGILDATSVATTSERILEVMDNITGLYQQLG
ncbi:MAG TPA: type IV pili methyl-accepting chemotaxis transducer N-terminal domain-containing protein [Burkholderiaceae bacterium]